MARGRNKRKPVVRVEHVDATPERIRMDESEFVNPAEIDSSEQGITLTRRFRASHLDRLYRNDKLTWAQWYAGDWFRNTHHNARFGLSVISSYGERTSASEPSYGLPRTERQLRARQMVMEARKQFPQHMLGFMERLLIHDDLPRYGGRASMRNIAQISGALNSLATWLKIGC